MNENKNKKPKQLKNRTAFTSTLDNKLHQKLRELHEETKVPISKLLDEAVELLIKKREKK